MAIELELKLIIRPSEIESASHFLNEVCERSLENSIEPTLQLMNGYFDTPKELLMNSGVALRIRAVNNRYIQTLKTRGTSRIGMHARGEWEWDIKRNMLDLSLLDEAMLPEVLLTQEWSKDLVEIFRTDFTRKVWLISHNNTQMEVVIDQGEVVSSYGREPISELELELKSGSEENLYNFAIELAHHVPVQVSTVSKAARGMRLKYNRIDVPKAPKLPATSLELSIYWYEVWLVYWEAMACLDDPVLLVPISDAMGELATQLPSYLANLSLSLRQDLNLIANKYGPDSLPHLLTLPSTGQVMLRIAQWLHQQS